MQNLILNRYRPLEAAGEGGFATVLAAWDTRIQRRVAIKCLRLDGYIQPADPRTPREIPGLEEARTAAMLSSPHIVSVLDFDMCGPQAFLIMEYMDGITLTQLMKQEGPLSLDVATCVFEAVASALETAHENQVLHLDIKPDNVLINRQGQVKVADFGLAQLSHAAGFASAAGGTIGYMPLEQMRLEACDARTDEWALAALTYQMLTGENPFIAPDLAAAERAIETAEVVIPSAARVDVGEEVDEALFGALAINREDRFDSVALFADAMLPNLGDARRGARELAVIVGEACDDYVEEGEELAEPAQRAGFGGRLSLVDRLGARATALLMRVWAAVACGVAGVVAATNIPACMSVAGRMEPAFWLVVGACVVAGAVWPGAGAALSVAALVAALGFSGSPVLAVVLGVFGLAWLVLGGFRRHAAANVGVSVVALGAFGMASVAPLLAGYFLNVKKAAATSAFAVVATFCLACAGSADLTGWNALVFGSLPGADAMNQVAFSMLSAPSTWVVAGTWVLAGVVGALLCSRDNRGLAALGVAASAAVLALGVVAASRIGGASMPDIAQLAPVLLGGVALACACIAGVPRRETPARESYAEYYEDEDEGTFDA